MKIWLPLLGRLHTNSGVSAYFLPYCIQNLSVRWLQLSGGVIISWDRLVNTAFSGGICLQKRWFSSRDQNVYIQGASTQYLTPKWVSGKTRRRWRAVSTLFWALMSWPFISTWPSRLSSAPVIWQCVAPLLALRYSASTLRRRNNIKYHSSKHNRKSLKSRPFDRRIFPSYSPTTEL